MTGKAGVAAGIFIGVFVGEDAQPVTSNAMIKTKGYMILNILSPLKLY
jgi:hypothetical protein